MVSNNTDKTMANVLSFKEYVDSKSRLVSALQEDPYQILEYAATKYVKLKVAGGEEIAIRPNYHFIVEWVHKGEKPVAINIVLTAQDVKRSIQLDEKELNSFDRWIRTNTKQV